MAYKMGKWTVNEDHNDFQKYLNTQILMNYDTIWKIIKAIASDEEESIQKKIQVLDDIAKDVKRMDETIDLSYITNDDSGRTPAEETLFYVDKIRVRLLAQELGIVKE